MQILPLSHTQINWVPFLKEASDSLGRSLTYSLDNRGDNVGDIRSYLCVLGELIKPNSPPEYVIKNAGSLLNHIQYSFMVIDGPVFDLLERTGLNITRADQVAIVSGNLRQWRSALIDGMSLGCKKPLRLFCDWCYFYFKKEGLSGLWSNYTIDKFRDGTFYITGK